MAIRYMPSAGLGGGGGAPTDAEYVVLTADGSLSDERVLTAGTGISITDAGAGSTVTIGLTTAQQEVPNRHFVMSMMGA